MSKEHLIVKNSVGVKDANRSHDAKILNALLSLKDIRGMERFKDGDSYTIRYNSKYFSHRWVVDGNPMILPRVDHEYAELIENLSNIDFTLEGELVETPDATPISEIANKFDIILSRLLGTPIFMNEEYHLLWYNDAYYTVVDNMIDLKDEYKQYMKEI